MVSGSKSSRLYSQVTAACSGRSSPPSASFLCAHQLLAFGRHDDVEVGFGRAVGAHQVADLHAAEVEGRGGGVVEAEKDLDDRIAADVALRLEGRHQLLEGHVLVRVGLERARPGALQEVGEGGLAVEGWQRSTMVLTVMPISASCTFCRRLATPAPMPRSPWPV